MSTFTIYDATTGLILAVRSCPSTLIEMQLQEGQRAIPGRPPVGCLFVDVEAELPTFAPERRPDSPGEGFIWSERESRWIGGEERAAAVRAGRDTLLSRSDWTQIADTPLSEEERAAWAAYRTELRDIPDQVGFPDDVSWPATPN